MCSPGTGPGTGRGTALEAGPGTGPGPERGPAGAQAGEITHPSLKIDLPKNRSPQKIDRGSNFEFWPKWAFFGPARPRE